MKLSDTQTLIEQIALLGASFVWTSVVLSVIALYWVYQDVNARWEYIAQVPPEILAEVLAQEAFTPTPTLTPSPTATVWAGPGPTATPTSIGPPTPVATLVVQAPGVLPETLNAGDPVPVIVHTDDEAQEFGVSDNASEGSVSPQFSPNLASGATASGLTPTKLVIESVGIDSDVVPVGWEVVEQSGQQYSIWKVADFAVGWHRTTAPLGQPGNTVMAGHHNVQGEVFRDLVNVEVGDKVVAYAAGQKYEYVIELKTIVKEKGEPLEVRQRNAQWISPTEDERLTFVTCWPYTNNTHRVIVVAKPI